MKVFISHSNLDKQFVRTLKADLRENNIDTWVDEDELKYGDSLSEKLISGLEKSTHFAIVLSQESVNSDWVKFELSKAKLLKDTALLKKIIPIKYRECEVPTDLSKLIFADLTAEIVQTDGVRVKFISDGYAPFLIKLIDTIRYKDFELTDVEKEKITGQINKNELLESEKNTSVKIWKFFLQIRKFSNPQQVQDFREGIFKNCELKNMKSKSRITPIILPYSLKYLHPKLEKGTEFQISLANDMFSRKVHLATFRKNGYSITMPPNVREELGVKDGDICLFEIDLENKTIDVIKEY